MGTVQGSRWEGPGSSTVTAQMAREHGDLRGTGLHFQGSVLGSTTITWNVTSVPGGFSEAQGGRAGSPFRVPRKTS